MLASNILTYKDFLKDSKEPVEIRKAMVRSLSIQGIAMDETIFTEVIHRTRHITIPPGVKTWHSEVETSHWIIEKEFYDYVDAPNIGNLLKKYRAYQWGW